MLAAAGLAALVGVQLGGWQRFALEAMLRRHDGHWASWENSVVVPRQNGKSVILLIRALAGALLLRVDVALPVLAAAVVIALAAVALRVLR